jgi:fibronectin-binding autotransporter adhesin
LVVKIKLNSKTKQKNMKTALIKTQLFQSRTLAAFVATLAALLLAGPSAWANGTAYYLDLNGTGSGFGTPVNNSTYTLPYTAATQLSAGFSSGNTVTSLAVSSATGIGVGQVVTGAGVPAGVTVTAISGTTITVSSFTAGANSSGYYFFNGASTALTTGFSSGATVTSFVVSSATGIGVGELVSGTGIPANSVVVTAVGGTTITVSSFTSTSASSGNYTFTPPWTTSSAGTATPGAFTSGGQMTFGNNSSDLANSTFSVNVAGGFAGIAVNSGSANITLTGAGSSSQVTATPTTWTVAAGSTLIENVLNSSAGLNFNSKAITLNGGGTINFASTVAYNNPATTILEENMTGGVVNMQTNNMGPTTQQGSYKLTAGTLNFATASSANAFACTKSPNANVLYLNGGTLDNTSGSALTLSMGTGGGYYNIGGNFTFAGSSSLNFGNFPVVISNSPTITVNNNTLTINGPITNGVLTETGVGTLSLGTSGSIASGGGLLVAGGSTLDIASVALNLPSGATLGAGVGGGTVNSSFTGSSGSLMNLGTNTLTVTGNVTLSGANNSFTLGATTNGPNGKLAISGSLNISGGVTTNQIAYTQLAVGRYKLITYTGSLTGSAASNLKLSGILAAGASLDDSINHEIDLVVSSPIGNGSWTGGSAVDSYWNDATNWGGIALPANGNLVFDGSTRLINTNNTAAGTTYSNLVFNSTAGAFVLNGNPITLSGNVTNNSANPETINLGLNFGIAGTNLTLNGGIAGLIVGNGLTNNLGAPGYTTLTLAGAGTLTNLLNSVNSPGGTNVLNLVSSSANWTIVDNPASAAITVPWAFNIGAGTLNFGAGSSAPDLTSTTPNAGPQDNLVGNVSGQAATLNIANGTLTTLARWDTCQVLNSTGIIAQAGGTINIANQFQGANGSSTGENSAVTISGGIMNLYSGSLTNNSATGFFVASRGTGSLTLSGTGQLNCGTLDVSRNGQGNTFGSVGVVNLNGGTLVAGRVGTATSGGQTSTANGTAATFNFNGGTLKANASSSTFFQGSTVAPVIPITTIVKSGGAIIDTETNSISFLEPLQHDPTLGGTPDGGLTKLGTGVLVLGNTNTYTGNTVVSNGTLELVQLSLATNSTVTIGSTAVLQLDPTGTNQIAGLTINGVSKASGIYSAATDPTYLTGLGSLLVGSGATGPTGPANLTNSVSGGVLSLSWPSGQGWKLQMQTNSLSVGLGTNWVYVTDGSTTSTNITINSAKPTVFYRLAYP